MIHAQDAVVFAPCVGAEEAVGREWSECHNTLILSDFDGWLNDVAFLGSHDVAVAGMRVEAEHRNLRGVDLEIVDQRLIYKHQLLDNQFFIDCARHVFQRDVVGDETDAHLMVDKKRNVFIIREKRFDVVGLALEFELFRLHVGFVDRSRYQGVDETVAEVVGGQLQGCERRFSRDRSGESRLHLQLFIGVIDDVDALRLSLRRVANHGVRHLFHAEIFLVI